MQLFDIVGVGFGPANLALAIALEEELPQATMCFLESQSHPVWQGGMLLDGSNIQNHPCRDLVSLRNPRSRFSFLNFLFEEGRLLEHLNLPVEFPLRKEYARYIEWAARQMAHRAKFGSTVQDISVKDYGNEPAYAVATSDGQCHWGRTLVFAPGRTPYIPAPFDGLSSPHVVHLTQYLQSVEALACPPRTVAVIGGSQSAVEVTLDLAKRFPQARVTNYVRSFGLRLKDTSPFSEEGYFPGFTEYYHRASRGSKQTLDNFLRPTNYSSVDDDVLKELYLLIYEQRLDGGQKVFVRGNRQVRRACVRGDGAELDIEEVHSGEYERDLADLVVLATGFRDLGPGPLQEPFPALLANVVDRFEFDADGYLIVGLDYQLSPRSAHTPPLFLNGLCESTHGIGDSGSFSLLSLRAAVIRDALRNDLIRPDDRVEALPGLALEHETDKRLNSLPARSAV